MKILKTPRLFLAFGLLSPLNGAVILSVDNFTDSMIWTATTSTSGSATITSGVTSSTLLIGKTGGTGGTRLTLSLFDTISTVGFENITIGFTLNSGDVIEWDGTLTNPVNARDGFRLAGDGVEINANAVNDLSGDESEVEIATGGIVQSATEGSLRLTSSSQADFTFDSSVDNSQISNLEIILQVNANAETLLLTNLIVSGDAIPEPAISLLLAFSASSVLLLRKRS